jgi:hypothetical protein
MVATQAPVRRSFRQDFLSRAELERRHHKPKQTSAAQELIDRLKFRLEHPRFIERDNG